MLGPLEREVVAVLEGHGEATTRDVLVDLRRRGKVVAYTTVSTILTRLHTKGLIGRRTESFKGGDRYVYQYKDIEEEYIDSLLGGLITAFGPRGVSHLVQRIGTLTEAEMEKMRQRIPR